MKKIFNFSLLVLLVGFIAACNQSPPKCSDEETLDLVRKIAFGEDYTKKELKDNILFENPLATAENSSIKKISCEAKMQVAETYQLPIKYESQLDDSNKHIVSIEGVSRGDALHLLVALNQAVEKTRNPVKPVETTVALAAAKPEAPSAQNLEVVIPAQFHGYWGSGDSCKVWKENPDARMGAPSPGLNVTATSINFIEGGCSLATVKTSSASNFVGAFRCTGDEGEVDTKLTEMTLKVDADKLSESGSDFTRCE